MKKFGVSKNFKITFASFVIGCVLFFPSLLSFLRFLSVSDLTASTASTLHAGSYVRCTVEEYYVLPIFINGNETGTSTGKLGSLTRRDGLDADYVVYYAHLDDSRYVRIGIKSPTLLSLLDEFSLGKGTAVRFTGKVYHHRDNEEYAQSVSSWKDFDASSLTMDYYVLETDEDQQRGSLVLRMVCGIFFLGLAIFLLLSGSGIYRLTARPLEETSEYVELARGVHYALQEVLEQKQELLAILRKRLVGLRTWALLGIFISLLGIATCMDSRSLWIYQYHFFLLGFFFLLTGLEMIWHAFINSGNSLALWLADAFTLDTIASRIRKEEILIGVIYKRLDEKQRKKKNSHLFL